MHSPTVLALLLLLCARWMYCSKSRKSRGSHDTQCTTSAVPLWHLSTTFEVHDVSVRFFVVQKRNTNLCIKFSCGVRKSSCAGMHWPELDLIRTLWCGPCHKVAENLDNIGFPLSILHCRNMPKETKIVGKNSCCQELILSTSRDSFDRNIAVSWSRKGKQLNSCTLAFLFQAVASKFGLSTFVCVFIR